MLFIAWRVPRILVFTVLSISFLYYTIVVQLLCSLSGWLHLNCSSIGTEFNGAKTNRLFAVGGHLTTDDLNQSALAKWRPEMERAG